VASNGRATPERADDLTGIEHGDLTLPSALPNGRGTECKGVENAIVTLLGIGVGLVLAFALNAAIVNSANNATRLPFGLVVLGVVIVWGVGAVATLLPALRAARIPPVIATRSV